MDITEIISSALLILISLYLLITETTFGFHIVPWAPHIIGIWIGLYPLMREFLPQLKLAQTVSMDAAFAHLLCYSMRLSVDWSDIGDTGTSKTEAMIALPPCAVCFLYYFVYHNKAMLFYNAASAIVMASQAYMAFAFKKPVLVMHALLYFLQFYNRFDFKQLPIKETSDMCTAAILSRIDEQVDKLLERPTIVKDQMTMSD